MRRTYLQFILLSSSITCAQAAAINTESDLWDLIESTYQAVEDRMEHSVALHKSFDVLAQPCDIDVSLPSSSADLLQEAEYWHKNYGVELRGGLTSGDLESSEIDQQGSTYLELSWDVLDNGYKEFDYRANDLKRRATLEQLHTQLNNLARLNRCREFQIEQSFIPIEVALSNDKLMLMEAIYQFEKKAYFEGHSKLDELLISEETIFSLRRNLEDLNARFNRQSFAFDVQNLQPFDLNIHTLIEDVKNDPRFKSVSLLEQQRAATINPYQDGNRLRFFLRKEFDLLSSNRDDLVAGVRFSVPLVFEDRPSYQSKVQQLEREQSIDEWERVNRVRVAYNSFKQQSERLVTQQYRYLRSKERLRRVFSRKLLDDPLVISAVVARLSTYIDASIELIKVKQSLFERANNVFLAARLDLSAKYLAPFPMSISDYRARPFARGVYVWSTLFNSVSNKELLLVAQTQGFNKLIISYSDNIDKAKLQDMHSRAKASGMVVEYMLSNNQLFFPENHQQASKQVINLSTMTDNVHLDIEPQALAGYKRDRQEYQNHYVTMLETIRKHSPDLHLSVSVPFHWELTTYQRIEKLVDEIVVMNYENDNVDTLVRRMKFILQTVPRKKLSLALRPKDFESPYYVEETIRLINKATGIDTFVMHKLQDIVEGR